MTERLNYILNEIHLNYLISNENVLKDGYFTCPKDMALPCNCIPGVVVNFSAFLTMLFLGEESFEAKFELSGDNGYIRCCSGSKKLFPIESREKDDNYIFLMNDSICNKSEGEQAYLPFHPYSDLPAIRESIREYKNKNAPVSQREYSSGRVQLELLIRLLSAMRARPLCESSRVFLFMSAYLSPKRTFRLIYENREEIEKEWLINFMSDYLIFLRDISDDALFGFKQRLIMSFRETVGFDISAFVARLEPKAGTIYTQMLNSSYRHNLSDLSRARTSIRRICEYLSDEHLSNLVDSLKSRQIA